MLKKDVVIKNVISVAMHERGLQKLYLLMFEILNNSVFLTVVCHDVACFVHLKCCLVC